MQLALAVDGHSMFYVQQKLGWFFDPRRLLAREFGGDADQRQFARANLDVEIAIDLLSVAHRIDEVWLLSGSRDLERLVEVLRIKGVKVVLISTDGMVPRELRNAADRFVDLAELRAQLEKNEAQLASAGRS